MKKFDFKCKECNQIFSSNQNEEKCNLCNSQNVFKYFGNADIAIADSRSNSRIDERLYAHKKYLQDQISDMKNKVEEL